MEFIQNIYNEHKSYYKEQKEEGRNISIKQILLIVLIGIPYLGFFMIGAKLDSRTIVSHEFLVLITSVLAIMFYLLLYLWTDKRRKDLKIIWNIIIIYVHSILFFSTVILLVNYSTINDKYIQTKLKVINWEETSSRSGDKTWATVKLEGNESKLDFKGHISDRVGSIKYLEVELAKGKLGFAYVKSYKLGEK